MGGDSSEEAGVMLSPPDVSVKPTLCVLQGFVAVNDIQPLRLQPLDQCERHQRVCHRSFWALVKFGVQAGHFGVKAVWKNMDRRGQALYQFHI